MHCIPDTETFSMQSALTYWRNEYRDRGPAFLDLLLQEAPPCSCPGMGYGVRSEALAMDGTLGQEMGVELGLCFVCPILALSSL